VDEKNGASGGSGEQRSPLCCDAFVLLRSAFKKQKPAVRPHLFQRTDTQGTARHGLADAAGIVLREATNVCNNLFRPYRTSPLRAE